MRAKTKNRVSYDTRFLAGVEGFEPSARGFGDRCSTNWAIPLYLVSCSVFKQLLRAKAQEIYPPCNDCLSSITQAKSFVKPFFCIFSVFLWYHRKGLFISLLFCAVCTIYVRLYSLWSLILYHSFIIICINFPENTQNFTWQIFDWVV